MPMYEGIGLISEKHAVVIDIGAAYTKCGFAGETAPRCIVRSQVKSQQTGVIQKIYKYKNKDDLYDMLVDFIHHLYFRYLLVNPKDRRVVVVESLLCPTIFRETLAKVFFAHYEMSSVLFVPSHLVALCTLGVNTSLVLDVGYQEAVLIPVYEGVSVLHAWQAQPLAADAVHRTLRTLLVGGDRDGSETSERQPKNDFTKVTEETIEDIKVRTCFVTSLERAHQLQPAADGSIPEKPSPPPDVSYQLGGHQVLAIPGRVREIAFEVMFEQDNDQMSVSTMILDALLKCPIDMRKALAENILLIGGTAMVMGFKARIVSEIKHLLKSPKYNNRLVLKSFKFHNAPAKENYVTWLGGAIFGATDMVITRSLTKEQYFKNNCIPDWANLLYNCKEEDKISL